MQKWEYLLVTRARGWKARDEKKAYYHEPEDWQITVSTRGNEKKWQGGIVNLLAELGDEGWELTGIMGRSNYLGGAYSITGVTVGAIDTPNFSQQTRGTIKGQVDGTTTDFAGYTNGESWVFKRPKQ